MLAVSVQFDRPPDLAAASRFTPMHGVPGTRAGYDPSGIKDEGIPPLFPRDFLGGQGPMALFRRPRVTPPRTQQTYRSTPMVSLVRRGGKLPLTALALALAIGIFCSSSAMAHGGGHGGGGGFGGMGHGGGFGHHGFGGVGGYGFYPGF